jgi:hypothetical protein
LLVGGRAWLPTKATTVVEDFTGELADFFGVVIAMELAGPFQPSLDGVEDGMAAVFGHRLDQVAQLAHQPFAEADAVRVEARARPLRIRWARQRWRRS